MSETLNPNLTARRLGLLLASYLLLIIAVITLAPFHLIVPDHFSPHWIILDGEWVSDILLNIVLFIPVGFVIWRSRPRNETSGTMRVFLVGSVLSLGIEATQLFIPGRYSTASDVLSNALGAWCGALLSNFVSRQLGEGSEFVGKLRLDLPLMGVVYLLLPLLWLGGLTARGGAEVVWPLLPLILAGALALSALSTQRPLACAGTALLWFVIGAVPLLRTAPNAVGEGAVVVVVAGWLGKYLWDAALRRDRRLEPQVVRALVPLIGVHLYLIAATPVALSLDGGVDSARLAILRWIGRAAAFTILGYLVAEYRGRRLEPWRRIVLIPVATSAVVIFALAAIGRGASEVSSVAVAIVATMFGATLYYEQRTHIVAILAAAKLKNSS